MNKHLPECWAKHESDPPAWCICDELRACEERVTNQSNREWAEISVADEARIWSEALDAAREAVEAMDLHGCHPYRGLLNCNCVGPKVIAAIDALREKP